MKTSTLDTAGNIYSAVGRPEAWTPLMAELCGLFKASIGIWVTPGQGQRDHSFYAAYNQIESVARAYSDHWWQHDVWLQAGYKKNLVCTGVVVTGTELVSTAELHASVFYRAFLSAIPIEHFLVAMVDDGSNPDKNAQEFATVLPTQISFFRPPGSEPFGQDDKAMLTELHPHLRRTFKLEQVRVAGIAAADQGAGACRHCAGARFEAAHRAQPVVCRVCQNWHGTPARPDGAGQCHAASGRFSNRAADR